LGEGILNVYVYYNITLTNARRHCTAPSWGQRCPSGIIVAYDIKCLLKEGDKCRLLHVTVWLLNHKAHRTSIGYPMQRTLLVYFKSGAHIIWLKFYKNFYKFYDHILIFLFS
jgi:hypothetical protein